MSPNPPRSQYVLCLAGHIDHGKSCLVRALTGATVDRLPEEQRRGITIELGFAHFSADGARFALIDVPGHEKFIHTMVAGASGVDAAVLVVAADDSVMPQTREHLALLQMLQVRRGVIAITKCDLADDEQLGLVELEIDSLVESTFLANAPRIRVSAPSGRGIDELRAAMIAAAQTSPARATDDRRFRLPIDRAFSPAGQGAVVTGTVWRGAAQVGDSLQLLPGGATVRVRRLQAQSKDVERVAAGERAAINLAGIKAHEIERGDELVTPDAYSPGLRHLVQLRLLPDAATLRHRQFVRVHLAAGQATAQVLLATKELLPGESAYAVLRGKTPLVAEYGQPFVVRQLSPAATVGGGVILAPALQPKHKLNRCLAVAQQLASADPATRVAAYVELHGETSFDAFCDSALGLSLAQVEAVVPTLVKRRELVATAGAHPLYVTAAKFQQLKELLLKRCRNELERRKPASQVPLSAVLVALERHARPAVLDALLHDMTARRELVRRGERVGLPTGPALTHRQQKLLDTFLKECTESGPAPPTIKEFIERQGVTAKDFEPLVQVALDEGRVVRLTPAMVIETSAIEGLRRRLVEHFAKHTTAKVGELRDHWGITRKHAVPIFEFFDERQITLRDGDLRSAGPRLSQPLDEAAA
ncbi:MAG: selenocysteine-specific translation elongation factor [Planctomycetaceae bacterium]|nr:selenocysteine-specific translation elongation factor [Planctomycetaceae bacterium]